MIVYISLSSSKRALVRKPSMQCRGSTAERVARSLREHKGKCRARPNRIGAVLVAVAAVDVTATVDAPATKVAALV